MPTASNLPSAASVGAGHHVSSVVIVVVVLTVLFDELHVLSVQQDDATWRLPIGLRARLERLNQAAARILGEQTDIDVAGQLGQLKTYDEWDLGGRGGFITVAYRAAVHFPETLPVEPDARPTRTWPVSAVLAGSVVLPEGQVRVVGDAVDRTRLDVETTDLALAFVDTTFTLSDLREVFDAVWEVQHDPANFRRTVLSADPPYLETTGKHSPSESKGGRPPELYRACSQSWLDGPPLKRPRSATKRDANRKLFAQIRRLRSAGRLQEALDLCPAHWTSERAAIIADMVRGSS